ncbi:MAG: hypothetical protein CBB97_07055 [Candidatus Endolissoclinum sp. TMED37]|nr:MAG: hypothetical protein CBB97_07055 [Candidatus Endolissoclinum sp. TMED37]
MLALIFLSSLAFADDIITVEKGQKAPFAGTLLSPDAAAKILVDSDSSLQKCLIDKKRDLALQEARLVLEKKNVEAEFAACTLRRQEMEALYEQHISFLERQAVKPKWEAPVYFIAGVVSSAGLIYGSSIILKNIGDNQ